MWYNGISFKSLFKNITVSQKAEQRVLLLVQVKSQKALIRTQVWPITWRFIFHGAFNGLLRVKPSKFSALTPVLVTRRLIVYKRGKDKIVDKIITIPLHPQYEFLTLNMQIIKPSLGIFSVSSKSGSPLLIFWSISYQATLTTLMVAGLFLLSYGMWWITSVITLCHLVSRFYFERVLYFHLSFGFIHLE